jgi:hypothetical protein
MTHHEPAVSFATHAAAMAYAEREIDAVSDRYLRVIEMWLRLNGADPSLDDAEASDWISIPQAIALERDRMISWRERTLAKVRERFAVLFANQ